MREEYGFEGTEDEFIESIEYVCASITNGQREQAAKIMVRNNYDIVELLDAMINYGVHMPHHEAALMADRLINRIKVDNE